MAHELAFAFGNETPQAQPRGLIIFRFPYLPLQAVQERWFLVLGAAAHHLGPLSPSEDRRGSVGCAWGMRLRCPP